MSKVAITGNASGTGTLTIAAPNTSTNRTLTLPDNTGTILTSGTPLSSFPSGFANGITEADSWRLTTDKTSNGDITSNLERVDESTSGILGSGMTESSGIFTFPETGVYLVITTLRALIVGPDNIGLETYVSSDGGSNYNQFAGASAAIGTGTLQNQSSTFCMIDVTSTANVKVKFTAVSIGAGGNIQGNTNENRTHFTFIRLGDT
jgi:hypothetical protein